MKVFPDKKFNIDIFNDITLLFISFILIYSYIKLDNYVLEDYKNYSRFFFIFVSIPIASNLFDIIVLLFTPEKVVIPEIKKELLPEVKEINDFKKLVMS